MTIAEIHGKISQTGTNLSERLEDLLTSDVFSACSYVRPETLLIPFFCTAKNLKNESLEGFLMQEVRRVTYRFWPWVSRCEPDALIAVEFLSGQVFLVLVEAKYFSEKSGTSLNEVDLEVALASCDQLAREYLDLEDAHRIFDITRDKMAGNALVYITAHRSMPIDSLTESVAEITKFVSGNNDPNLFWTSWFELHAIVSQARNALDWERAILDDLQRLLKRKRLVRFKGFGLAQITAIEEGSIYVYKPAVREKPREYSFALASEQKKVHPMFYLMRTKSRSYHWKLEHQQLLGKIYQKGVPGHGGSS